MSKTKDEIKQEALAAMGVTAQGNPVVSEAPVATEAAEIVEAPAAEAIGQAAQVSAAPAASAEPVKTAPKEVKTGEIKANDRIRVKTLTPMLHDGVRFHAKGAEIWLTRDQLQYVKEYVQVL